MGFRFFTPVAPRSATGLVAEVYRQQAADVGLARMAALMTLSPAPDLLAATWSLLRESLMAGPGPRADREVVALGVSLRNRCPFCVDAHTMFLHATGDHELAESLSHGGRPDDPRQAALFGWGLGDGPAPPWLTPQHLGTALAFHFINRMVSALHTPDMLPGGLQRSRAVRSLTGRALSRSAQRELPPGASLRLLPSAPPAPAWADGSPVGTAYAALSWQAGEGRRLLADPGRLRATVARWDGEHPPMGSAWLDEALAGVSPGELPAVRLATLAALAPYRITEGDVARWRSDGRADEDLVRLVAFAAATAMGHAESRFIRHDRPDSPPSPSTSTASPSASWAARPGTPPPVDA
ncbi:carboxymuconolactone decarboxylase family protein [Nonomuraea sp. NBC_01738]|uniref:carboxymuconolactone decarboxylase family protein n=1 Tax=Nonomuraea sp. NBC_01738 TaxID=2976003 RepID=UPI002E0FD19D|nr:carboxymuconolactone decarboxylase family protein [Nonomuraea sp. NBC_01738]